MGFEMLAVGQFLWERPLPVDHNPFQPHRLKFFALLVVREGQLSHQVDVDHYQLQAGEALVIAPGQIHAFQETASAESFSGLLFIFTEVFLLKQMSPSAFAHIARLYNYHLRSPLYQLTSPNFSLLDALTREFHQEDDEVKAGILAGICTSFLLQLTRNQAQQLPVSTADLLFDRFRELVVNQYATNREASAYAEQLHVSYKHLNETCKACVGQTAKRFIDAYVMLESKRMLISTSLSVKEISYACGFEEPTNFQKFFRKHAKMTPLAFRNKG
ncbi:MAG: helix-turn-helix domain-containing protein, partial [Bacteroidota bacterium]